MIRDFDWQMERQHADKMHRPNAEAQNKSTRCNPAQVRYVFGVFQAAADIECNGSREDGDQDGKGDKGKVIGTDEICYGTHALSLMC